MGEYEDRWTRSSAKPECYGDLDTYDSADEVCQECPVRRACRIVVDRKLSRDAPHDRPAYPQPPQRTQSEGRPGSNVRLTIGRRRDGYTERVLLPTDSFLMSLMLNGALGSAETFLSEAQHGIRSIPRAPYPDPWAPKRREDE